MKKKILIVDDNEVLIKIVEILLKDSYETLLANNGAVAVGLTIMEVPDLILMDLMTYKMNGLIVVRLIRQNPKTRSIPILAITGGLSNTIEDECSRIGCDDYLSKPFTPAELSSRMTKLLTQHST